MQDSDDYFDDDFTLTEKDLASIDEAESRYLAQTQDNAPPRPTIVRNTPPPAKRQKTTHVWNQTPNEPSASREVTEMPEITVKGDGSYAVHGERSSSGVNGGSGVIHRPRVPPRPLSKTPSAHSSQNVNPAQANRPRAQAQSISRASSSGSGVFGQRAITPTGEQSRPGRQVTPALSRRGSGTQILQRTATVIEGDTSLNQELQALRAQLAQVRAPLYYPRM